MILSDIYKGSNHPIHLCTYTHTFDWNFLLQTGNGKTKDILVVGESPALHGWIESNRAFYTKDGKIVASGKVFNKLFAPCDIQIENISFTELCKCVVGGERKLLDKCSPHRWKHFILQVKHLQPKLIILLGKQTTTIFSKLSGCLLEMGEISRVTIDNEKYKILPLFHPSPVNPHSFEKNTTILKKHEKLLKKITK